MWLSRMSASRVPPIDPEHLRPDQKAVFDQIAGTRGRVAGPFTVLLHVPDLADRIQNVGAYLRYEASLDRDVAETAVLVTGRVRESEFEWEAHEPLARKAGVPDEVIRTIRSDGPTDAMPARFRTVVDYVRAIASTGNAPDATYATAFDLLGAEGMVELTVLVGYYALLAMTLAAHHVEEPGAGLRFFARSADESG